MIDSNRATDPMDIAKEILERVWDDCEEDEQRFEYRIRKISLHLMAEVEEKA